MKVHSNRKTLAFRLVPLVLFILAGSLFSAGAANAQSSGLAGYWRGSGHISPSEGARERVRCRVWITRESQRSYRVVARCASQGANIDQSGRVVQTGSNRFAGEFYNSDYNIRGRIHISLRGNRQYVSMRSESGSGSLELFRR